MRAIVYTPVKAVVWVLKLNDAVAEHFKTLVLVFEVRTQRHKKLKPFKTNQTERERVSHTHTAMATQQEEEEAKLERFLQWLQVSIFLYSRLLPPKKKKKNYNLLINWELN